MMMSKTHGRGSASGKIGLQAACTKAEVNCSGRPCWGFLFTPQPDGRLLLWANTVVSGLGAEELQ